MNDLKFSTYLQNKVSELKVATITYLKEKIIKIISVLFALAVAAINRYNRVDLDLFELQTKTMNI